jgi:cell wall-associated NlpC family hydrolase
MPAQATPPILGSSAAMRFGPSLLLVVVLLLAFPAAGAAVPARSVSQAVPAGAAQAKREERPAVVRVALRYLGLPYRWAGASPAGFDCSGFVMYVYRKVGVALPHSSWMLWGKGRYVSRKHLRPGDVVFFAGMSHVGIYIGHGRFVHSPHTGDVVKVSRLSGGRYRSTYAGTRRYRHVTRPAVR